MSTWKHFYLHIYFYYIGTLSTLVGWAISQGKALLSKEGKEEITALKDALRAVLSGRTCQNWALLLFFVHQVSSCRVLLYYLCCGFSSEGLFRCSLWSTDNFWLYGYTILHKHLQEKSEDLRLLPRHEVTPWYPPPLFYIYNKDFALTVASCMNV